MVRRLVFALLASAFVAGPAHAGDPGLYQMLNLGTQVIGEVSRQQARAEAAERRRIAAEDEAERVAELRRTKAGRKQLAREEAERRKQQQAAAALVGAIGLSIIGGGGGGGGSSSRKEYYYERSSESPRNGFCGKSTDGTNTYGSGC